MNPDVILLSAIAFILICFGFVLMYALGYTSGIKAAEKQFCDKYIYNKKNDSNG